MKKAIVWIKTSLLALPMTLSSFHSRKQPFSIVYDTARLWTLMFLKIARVKIRIHNKNYMPLKDGVLFVVVSGSSIDQEIVLSSLTTPFVSVLSRTKRLFLLSKAWQKRLNSVVLPDVLSSDTFENSINVLHLVPRLDAIDNTLLQQVVDYHYPIVLLDIDNAHRAIDEHVMSRVVVDVKFHIPIVYEEYNECTLTEIKLMLHTRKEGTVYEHD